jgi:gas vesicle protein
MGFTLGLLVGLVIGFVAGFLVFRNNQKKFNTIEDGVKDKVEDIKNVLEK